MRPAKRGEEVVQRDFVRQIDHCKAQTPLVPVGVEEIVVARREIKKMSR